MDDMADRHIPDDLVHAAFFFVDIVGLSDPILSTETQRTKIKILNECVYNCQTFISAIKENIFVLPTGDGMLIGFKNGLEQPINLAIELHEKLKKYNQSVPITEKIGIRIGCNAGNVFLVKDIFGNINLWGPGAILARRVMDIGDEDHILLTAPMTDDLKEFSDEYSKILHPIHDYEIKHDEKILVYTAYGPNFGNKNPPKKTEKNKKNTRSDIEKDITCEKIIYNIRLKDLKTNLMKHERIYYLLNNTETPIFEFVIEIITNTDKQFQDLNVRVVDETDHELKISQIIPLSPYSKKITVKLAQPIFTNESGRAIKIHYEVAEPEKYFESIFLTGTMNFELNFGFQYDFPIMEKKLYHIDVKNGNKMIVEESRTTSKGLLNTVQWEINTKINPQDMIRLEWK